jgi:hypothetical protein
MKTPIILLTLALSVCSVWAADVTGVWKAQFDTQRGLQKYTFTLQQDGTKVTGNASAEVNGAKRESELKEGKIEGDVVSFVEPLNIQGNDLRITYTGKVSVNEIKFTRQVGDFASTEAVAKRESATAPAQPAPGAKTVRIKAGKSEPVKDAEGNVWLADQGFAGGQTIERPEIQIANTKSPDIYRAERYSMDSFSWPVPDGKYVVKLHFAETFEGITGPGQRVFSYTLKASSPNDTNSLEEPQKIVPRTEKLNNLGADFTREFAPYSITVLKLKVK